MMNDFTSGEQIFLHKLRMFFQVLNRSFKTAFFVSIIIVGIFSYKQLDNLDLQAAMTYQKAWLANGMDNATSGFRKAYNPNGGDYYTKMDAYNKKRGLYAKDVDPRAVLKSRFHKGHYLKLIDFVKEKFMIAVGVMADIFLIIYIVWSRFGKAAKEKKHLSGHTIKTSKEVTQILKNKNMASFFHLRGTHLNRVSLVKDSETKHILVTDSTGSGKKQDVVEVNVKT